MKSEYRHRETSHEADARRWGSKPWYDTSRKARAVYRRATRRALRHAARAELRAWTTA